MIRPRSALAAAAALACSVGVAWTATASAGMPHILVSTTCAIPSHGQHLGPTYLTALTVKGTNCATGLAVVRGYHACQLRRGNVKAICAAAVTGFVCKEQRGPSISTEFFSAVTCTDGPKQIVYKYAQFT